jgi:hypothetical protein
VGSRADLNGLDKRKTPCPCENQTKIPRSSSQYHHADFIGAVELTRAYMAFTSSSTGKRITSYMLVAIGSAV